MKHILVWKQRRLNPLTSKQTKHHFSQKKIMSLNQHIVEGDFFWLHHFNKTFNDQAMWGRFACPILANEVENLHTVRNTYCKKLPHHVVVFVLHIRQDTRVIPQHCTPSAWLDPTLAFTSSCSIYCSQLASLLQWWSSEKLRQHASKNTRGD